MQIMMNNPFAKKNVAAFSGEMHCPYCSIHVDPKATPIGFESTRTKIRTLENVGPFIRRYQCGLCDPVPGWPLQNFRPSMRRMHLTIRNTRCHQLHPTQRRFPVRVVNLALWNVGHRRSNRS